MWTSCKGEVLDITWFGKGSLCILAFMQYLHWEQMSSFIEILTLLLKEDKAKWRSLEQGCPSLWCHSIALVETTLLTEELKARDEEIVELAES